MSENHVWAVVFGNYEPPEIDSLWTTEARAEERAQELNRESDNPRWGVMGWTVRE